MEYGLQLANLEWQELRDRPQLAPIGTPEECVAELRRRQREGILAHA